MRRHLFKVAILVLMPLSSGAAQQSPYVGMENRSIKALSAEQVDAYLLGKGMGLALAAELNGLPGPKHVLELSAELELTDDQREEMEGVYSIMNERAVALGGDIVERETLLDKAFLERTVTRDGLREQLDALGLLRGELRFTHLAAHLETVDVLTDHQVMQYQSLRGYEGEAGHRHGEH